MQFIINHNFSRNLKLIFCLLAFLTASAACGVVRNPMRDRSEKPFDSKEWREGDAVERARMVRSLYIQRVVNGKTTIDVARLLGEPDKKKTVEGREVWLYRVDYGSNEERPFFPVSFDTMRGAYAGQVTGGTISIAVGD